LGLINYQLLPTWTRRRILIVIAIAILYGIWFNILDSAGYCLNQEELQSKSCNEKCVIIPVGNLFGGDLSYQSWNVIGHLIPGLFLVWWTPKKVELFVAGALISSVVMDSPLWGVIRLDAHALPLWYLNTPNAESFANTCDISKWIPFYYNPVGAYGVWSISIGFPSAAVIFWSLVGRSLAAGLLIWWQAKQEKDGKEFSLPKLVLRFVKRPLD
jgi:hypothetical protein